MAFDPDAYLAKKQPSTSFDPDAYLQAKVVEKPAAPAPSEPDTEGSSNFVRAIRNYLPGLQETYGGAKVFAGLAAKKIGATDTAKSLIEGGIETMDVGQGKQVTRDTDSFTNAWEKGIGSVVTDWLPYQAGAGVASVAETLAMMGIGAGVGFVTGAGVGALPGAIGFGLSKTLAKQGVKELAEKIAKEQGEEAAQKYVQAEAKKAIVRMGTAAGTTAGMVGQAGLHGAGEVTGRAAEEAKRRGERPEDIEMSRILPAAVAHSVADFFINKIGLNSLKIGETGTKYLAADIAKRIGITGLKEIPAEEIQTIAERYGAKLSLTDAEAVKEYVDTAAAAFGMSAVPGGIGGARTHLANKFSNLAKQEQEQEQEQEKATTAAKQFAVPLEEIDPALQAALNLDTKYFKPIPPSPTDTSAQGEQNVAGTNQPPVGTSTSVAEQLSTNAASAPSEEAQLDGMVSTGAITGQPPVREEQQPSALENLQPSPFKLTRGEVTPEAVSKLSDEQLSAELNNIYLNDPENALVQAELTKRQQGTPSGTTTPKAVQTKTQGQKTAAQQDEDILNDLLGGNDSTLSARRTDAEISRDEQLDKLGNRYGLSRSLDESAKEFGARIKEAIEFEKMREGKPLSALSDQDIAKQTLRKDGAYIPPDLQIEEYERQRQKFNESIEKDPETGELESDELPAYKELSADDRRVYFQEGLMRPGAGTEQEHARAARRLSDYRSGVKEEAEPYQVKDKQTGKLLFNEDGTPMMANTTLPGESQARESYNRERSAFGRKTGLSYSFPAWNTLSEASKRAYIAINKTDTALEQDMAFRAVKKQIQKDKAEQSSEEFVAQAEVDAQRQMLDAAERARKSQPAGKGDVLPNNILDALFKGDIKTVLDYISENGNGLKLKRTRLNIFPYGTRRVDIRNSIAMMVFRNLAGALGNIDGLKVNVVYDENMIYDQLARYDANTNTMYVGPNGLDEATILHELTHAATVKIIHKFFTNPSVLPERTRRAVEHLRDIASAAQKRLGSKYPNAFENLYEFIAYAMTDMDFQYDLAQIQVFRLAKTTAKTEKQSEEVQLQREVTRGATMYDSLADTLWTAYTGTLAYMYNLFTPGAKTTRVLTLVPTKDGEDIKNKVQNPGRGLTGKAREDAIAAFNKKLREEKERDIQRKGEQKKTFEEKVKKAIKEVEESEAGLSEAEKFDRAIERLNKSRKLTANEKAAFDIESLFDNEKEANEAKIPDIDTAEYVNERGVTNLKREILREPGFKGNLLLEASEMFQLILAAPEGGIPQLAGKESIGSELAATKKVPKKAPKVAETTKSLSEDDEAYAARDVNSIDEDDKSYDLKDDQIPKGWKYWKRKLGTTAGWQEIARDFQNDRYHIKEWERELDLAGEIYREGQDKINNIYEQIVRSTGIARNYFNRSIADPSMELNLAVGDFAKALGVKTDQALNKLHRVLEALHEPERRMIKFIFNVPLSKSKTLGGGTISPAQARSQIVKLLDTNKMTKTQAKDLRAKLDAIIFKQDKNGNIVYKDGVPQLSKNVDPLGDSPAGHTGAQSIDFRNESLYSATGMSPDSVKSITGEYKKHPNKKEIDRVLAAIKTLTDRTADLNRLSNYWSFPVDSRVNFYGWDYYVPLKGTSRDDDKLLDFNKMGSGKNGREFQEAPASMEGRHSVSTNPVLQVMSDATRSAMRAGLKDVTQSVKNAINQKLIPGKVLRHITFEERKDIDPAEFKGETSIFHYNEDGSIDVLQISEPKLLNSVRRTFKKATPFTDIANTVTSTIGKMHTRYNYQFAPLNFVRDMLTNAFTIGAELGPTKAAKFLGDVATMVVAKNGLYKAMQVAILYEKGDAKSQGALRQLAKTDPYLSSMVEFIEEGGMVSYLQGMSIKSNFQELHKDIGRSGIMYKKEQLEKFIDTWTDMFEIASRAAAYKIAKETALSKGESEKAAKVRASAYAKNLANFEQVGEYGKALGAAYMFFRPAATGAVRAIEAVVPAFPGSLDRAMERLSPSLSDKARETFKKNYKEKTDNSRIMLASLTGLGVIAYMMALMMSDDDDLGRNAVATDNMQQWTRFARFHIPKAITESMGIKEPVVFQLPWGFGLGAFMASGAQLAAYGAGKQSFTDMAANIFTQISLDSFVPIPVSRMPPGEMPLEFFLDSVMPSAVRPILEFALNKNGLGQKIYNDQNRKFGDAYTGGDKIPQIYKDAAIYLADTSIGSFFGEVDVSPNTLYFLSNSYIDGIARIADGLYGIVDTTNSRPPFNPKTDLPLVGSFFGARSNVDSREFSKVENQIKAIERQIKMYDTKPEKAVEYDTAHPMNRPAVELYNKMVNGELRDLRREANITRRDQTIPADVKRELIAVLTLQQNIIKRQMIDMFEAYEIKP